MVYILDGQSFGAPDSLFSGDLLFIGGCGEYLCNETFSNLKIVYVELSISNFVCHFDDRFIISVFCRKFELSLLA